MNRRNFLKAASAAAAFPVAIAQPTARKSKPNVLYIFSDQHRACSMPGEPHSGVIAPNLDAFRKQNVSMEACISNYPLCTPHRAILLSGKYPAETGCDSNGPPLPTDTVSIGMTFRDAGYHTGYVGKWHVNGDENGFIPKGPKRFGFEDWHVWDQTNLHYKGWTYNPDTGEKIQPADGYTASYMTDQAVEFLGKQTGDKPFFLVLSWNPPHPPYNPPEKDLKLYPRPSIQRRPNVRFAIAGQQLKGIRHFMNDDAALREAEQGYYGAITAIDLEFARSESAQREWPCGQYDCDLYLRSWRDDGLPRSHGKADAT